MDEVSWIKMCKWDSSLTKAERAAVEASVKQWLRGEVARIATPRGVTVEIHGDRVLAVVKEPPARKRI